MVRLDSFDVQNWFYQMNLCSVCAPLAAVLLPSLKSGDALMPRSLYIIMPPPLEQAARRPQGLRESSCFYEQVPVWWLGRVQIRHFRLIDLLFCMLPCLVGSLVGMFGHGWMPGPGALRGIRIRGLVELGVRMRIGLGLGMSSVCSSFTCGAVVWSRVKRGMTLFSFDLSM